MPQDLIRRAATVCILSVVLFTMLSHYGAIADQNGHDKTRVSHRKLLAYDEHVGDQLYFWGKVINTTGKRMVVLAAGKRLRIVGTEANASSGDIVQVAGIAESNRVVSADRVVVSPRAHLRYLYVVSVIGGVLTAVAFFREWSIQWRRLLVRPRREGDD